MARPKKYPEELMDRGVRLALEAERPIAHVARDLGVSRGGVRKRVRRAEVDAGKRDGLTPAEEGRSSSGCAPRFRAATGEHDPEGGVGLFREGARSEPAVVSAFIDQARARYGVEPVLPDPGRLSVRVLPASQRRAVRALAARRAADRPDPRGALGELRVLRYPRVVARAASARASRSGGTESPRLMRSGGHSGREAAREAVADNDRRSLGAQAP